MIVTLTMRYNIYVFSCSFICLWPLIHRSATIVVNAGLEVEGESPLWMTVVLEVPAICCGVDTGGILFLNTFTFTSDFGLG